VQCRDVDQADRIFASITQKTVFMYGAIFKGKCIIIREFVGPALIILGYIFNGMPERVLQMISAMSVQPDEVIAILLFNACAKTADPLAMNIGKHVLNQLPTAFFENQKLVSAATDMLMKFGDVKEAERLFHTAKKKSVVLFGAMMQGQSNQLYHYEEPTFVSQAT
jgi:hypothetical protein